MASLHCDDLLACLQPPVGDSTALGSALSFEVGRESERFLGRV